jgi:hypothetical protein
MEGTLRPESVRDEASVTSRWAAIPWMRDALRRMPCLAASAIAHLALLLVATVIVFSVKGTETELPPTKISVGIKESLPTIPLPVKGIERKYDPNLQRMNDEEVDGRPKEPENLDPDAILDKENESANDDPHRQRLGSPEFPLEKFFIDGTGLQGFDKKAVVDGLSSAIGVGASNGRPGGWGGPFGGLKNRRRITGTGISSYGPVEAGLLWLARHQDPDGRWSSDGFAGCCPGGKCAGAGMKGHDIGMTGLGLLAFLGSGITPSSREPRFKFLDPLRPGRTICFADTVRTGLRWLMDHQDADGCFGEREGEFMYDHAIAALAMTEAAWLTLTPLYKDPARRGIDFLCKARNPGFAWRYGVRPGDNDTSVTGWAVMALKSAELSGIPFDHEAYTGVREWLRRATNAQGKVGYESPGDMGSVLEGLNDKWRSHPAMTAAGLLARIFIDKKGDPWMKVAANEIVKDLPVWDEKARSVDFYYWYYASLALFQFDAPSGSAWKAMDGAMKNALIPNQAKPEEGCTHGSWDPAVDRWGMVGGRVYATALNVLTLEVSFRYPQVFVGNRTKA